MTSRMKLWLEDWGHRLADLLFPPVCLSCGVPGSWFCADCVVGAVPTTLGWCGSCPRMSRPDRTLCDKCGGRVGIRNVVSCYQYEGSIEALIRSIKFRPAQIGLGSVSQLPLFKERCVALAGANTVIVPIPMSADRINKRGFNQAEVLAKAVATLVPGTILADDLRRVRTALPQVHQSASQRQANTDHLFTWSGEPLTGTTCLLVDDVWTTGATLGDAARALRAAGARVVKGFVLAQTPAAKFT